MVHLAMLLHSALSAVTYLAAKRALAELSPAALALVRFMLAAAVHLLVLARLRPRIERRDLLGLTALGVLAVAVNQALFLGGLALSTPGHASLLYATTPIFVFLLARLRGQERATRLKVLGIGVAFAGTLVVLLGRGALGIGVPPEEATRMLVGDVMLVGAVFTWAGYVVGGKAYAARYGGMAVGSVSLVAGTLATAPLGLLLVDLAPVGSLSAWGAASLGYLVLGTSVVAWLVYYWALGRAEASRVAVWANLQPVLTALLAWAAFGEALTGPFVAGGAMVLAGVLLTERG